MKVRIVVDFDIEFDTDGEELDMDQIKGSAMAECHQYVLDQLGVDEALDGLVDRITDATDFLVSAVEYDVKF